MSTSQSRNSSTSAIKLVQDISKLLNNHQGSDVQFHVGGNKADSSFSLAPELKHGSSAMGTMYAHSAILCCRSRYFATMFENGEEWKKCTDGIIYRPDIRPSVFHKVLEYIYTGNTHAQTDILLDLITAAEEMELEELSIECQANVIKVLEQAFLGKGVDKSLKESNQQDLPLPLAISKILLPALSLAHSHTMSDFFQQLFGLTVNHIKTIFDSSYARFTFFKEIPSQIFRQILASDELEMREYDIWKLAFSMACHKSSVMQSAVEAYFRLECHDSHESKYTSEVGEEGSSEQQALISEDQLKRFKDNLTTWLPAIRFSLIEGDQYSRIVEILNYVLPPRRSFELQKFYAQSDRSKLLDLPRLNGRSSPLKNENINEVQSETLPTPIVGVSLRDILQSLPNSESSSSSSQPKEPPPPPQPKKEPPPPPQPKTQPPPPPKTESSSPKNKIPSSQILAKSNLWLQLKIWIFESDGLTECLSSEKIQFDLLFRARDHDFLASAFHKHCDDKGPTIVIIKSDDGHIFGGVNFAHWKSVKGWSGTTSNFLFALEDGKHREISAAFSYCGKKNHINATRNDPNHGPRFGENDILICDKANTSLSTSFMPLSYVSYDGPAASKNALAGKQSFLVKDYEVFAISTI